MDRLRRLAEITFSGVGGSLLLVEQQYALGIALILLSALTEVAYDERVRLLLTRYLAGRWAGLSLTIPVAPASPAATFDRDGAVKAASQSVRSVQAAVSGSTEVRVLVTSGFHVVGTSRHPGWLYEELQSVLKHGRLEVLLLDPASPASKDRASRVMPAHIDQAEAYEEGTRAVLWTLRTWAVQNGWDLEVRTYTEPPIWQMICVPKDIFLLMAAGGKSTTSSPVWVLRRGLKYGLSWGLEAVWDRRWAGATVVDLPTLSEPDWAKVQKVDA